MPRPRTEPLVVSGQYTLKREPWSAHIKRVDEEKAVEAHVLEVQESFKIEKRAAGGGVRWPERCGRWTVGGDSTHAT